MRYLKDGLLLASREPFAIGTLFLFHFIWGWFFYRFIQTYVSEIMGRFPPAEFGGERVDLFVYESILLLRYSEIATPVLWVLLAFIAANVLLTPLLHAGLYNSLLNAGSPRGTAFVTGARRFGGSFTWLYLLRLALTAIPLYWALPAAIRQLSTAESYLELTLSLAPWFVGIALYGALLKLFFIYLLLALTADERLLGSLAFVLRHFPAICGLALAVFGVSVLLGMLVHAASLYWAGFFSVILYLAYPLLQIWLKVWSIAVQYRYWAVSKN